jgi:glycine oxidase
MKVVVVGGGIIGCATAWELVRAGCAVTLFERATPGAEASSAAAGLLAPLGDTPDSAYARLALASWRQYPALAEELRRLTGIDVEYMTRGTIYPLLSVEDVRRTEARVADRLDPTYGIEVWDAADVRANEPSLSTQVRGAMFVGADHWVNNQRLVVAYAQAAIGAGVVLRSGSSVTRVAVERGHVRGVVAEGELWEADTVVLTAGAWTGELLASFGARLPLEPRRGQMLALGHVPAILNHCIHGDDVYLVPRPSGELLIGATVERVGFQRAVTAEGIAGLLASAIELCPALGALPIARTWWGFRPWAPDSLPVLGPWPEVEGLWLATAHYRNGILLAPITARVMTDWITTGDPGMDVEDFLPARFVRRSQVARE